MKLIRMNRNPAGFTLIEMIVVIAVFSFVLMIVGVTFKNVMGTSRISFGSEQSNIEGVVGLEMLRHDLQQTGFGLFTDEDSAPVYAEASSAPYTTYNDAGSVPRALVTGNDVNLGDDALILAGTDHLAIKGTTVSRDQAAQLWSYITDSGLPRRWNTGNFVYGPKFKDVVIAVDQRYDRTNGQIFRKLIRTSAGKYAFTYKFPEKFKDDEEADVDDYQPPLGRRFYIYGVNRSDNGDGALRAPFNRTDYLIRQIPNAAPTSCSPDAGILYKMTMEHVNGSFTAVPILDCVADMQVVLGWNDAAQPGVDPENIVFSNADGTTVSGATTLDIPDILTKPNEIQRRLSLIKVYILAQDGVRDLNFINTNNQMVVGDPDLGEAPLTKTVDLTVPGKVNYRWKLYRIIVKPKNL